MKTFIVIPCYNEAEHLAKVIAAVKPYGQVVLVDDGSTDQSFNIAKNCGVIVLRHLVNRGMGAALETGDSYAFKHGADVVVHFDADGQHLAEEIPRVIEPISQGKVDVVLGSRFLDPGNNVPFLKKLLILKPAILFQNLLLGVKLTDAHNGFRALSYAALSKIKITQDEFAHATEIIELIKAHNLRYQEVPVTVKYHEFGQGFSTGLKILKDLFFGKINR
ncbi:MAG: glycosyltransferase family 2 protein [Candidatus Komeilibacteria bacterium]|nr:glycosyltransferase family 2 protein [Candidatus Komeilibacteria bacterium]